MTRQVISRDVRRWLYGILLAGVPLLIVYGVVDDATGPLWIALGGAMLAPTLALAYVPDDSCPLPDPFPMDDPDPVELDPELWKLELGDVPGWNDDDSDCAVSDDGWPEPPAPGNPPAWP